MEKAIDFCFRKEGTAGSVVPTVDKEEASGALMNAKEAERSVNATYLPQKRELDEILHNG
jgi:hypothetical protein